MLEKIQKLMNKPYEKAGIHPISTDLLLDAYEIVQSLYETGPFVDTRNYLDLWYKSQELMMKTNPELVQERKERFNNFLNDYYEEEREKSTRCVFRVRDIDPTDPTMLNHSEMQHLFDHGIDTSKAAGAGFTSGELFKMLPFIYENDGVYYPTLCRNENDYDIFEVQYAMPDKPDNRLEGIFNEATSDTTLYAIYNALCACLYYGYPIKEEFRRKE